MLESLGNARLVLGAVKSESSQLFLRTENAMAADNQQESLDPKWVVGFVDGEGCFHVSINRQPRMTIGWQVLPEFRVVQHSNDEAILNRLQQFFKSGAVVVNHDTRKELRIRRLEDLNRVVVFFNEHPLQTKKQKDFQIFSEILSLIESNEHLTVDGLTKIARLCWKMNRKVKPKYLESSETIRQKSLR
jgi:LAGLIDADG endonuclease